MGSLVYLAGPINGCTDDEAASWRDILKARFTPELFLDPMRRDYRGKEDESYEDIVAGDLADIEQAGLIVANCWQPSYGTAMELWAAHSQHGTPILVVSPPGKPVSPWLRFISVPDGLIVHSLDDVVTYLEDYVNSFE